MSYSSGWGGGRLGFVVLYFLSFFFVKSIPILGYMVILPCFCWPLYHLLLFSFNNHLWPELDCQMLLAALSSSVNPQWLLFSLLSC